MKVVQGAEVAEAQGRYDALKAAQEHAENVYLVAQAHWKKITADLVDAHAALKTAKRSDGRHLSECAS